MEDRNVQFPMRYRDKLTGQIFDFEEMPGLVTNEGMPLNKANLLSDEVAKTFGLSGANATPNNALAKAVPAGSVIWYTLATPPDGYLICNGAAVSRVTYSRLYAVIGSNFGAGDGRTTFNLPDLRGAFVRGADLGKNIAPDATIGKIKQATLLNAGSITNNVITDVSEYDSTTAWPITSGWAISGSSGQGNNGTGRNFRVRPYNMALLPCIKY